MFRTGHTQSGLSCKRFLFLGFAALAACSEAAPDAPMPVDPAARIESALLPTFAIRVDLDAEVNTYLRSWLLPFNELTTGTPVTLRGLLTHRAGLGVSGFPGYGPDEPVPDAPGVLDGRGYTDPVRVVMTPGERWRYSGGGYTVMQQLVADVRGEPFTVVMQPTNPDVT